MTVPHIMDVLLEGAPHPQLYSSEQDIEFITELKTGILAKIARNCESWFSQVAEEATGNKTFSIANGIFYLHSHLNKVRIPNYFGDFFTEQRQTSEEIVNKFTWQRDTVQQPTPRVRYHHALRLLADAPWLGCERLYLLLVFDPKIRERLKLSDARRQDRLLLLPCDWDLPGVPPGTADAINRLQTAQSPADWAEACTQFGVQYDDNHLPLINRALVQWGWDNINIHEPWRMFANIYRYMASLRDQTAVRADWPMVLYAIENAQNNYRSGLVCSLRPSTPAKATYEAIQQIADSISDHITLISGYIHYLEMGFLDKKGLLPFSDDTQTYADRWFTPWPVKEDVEKGPLFDQMTNNAAISFADQLSRYDGPNGGVCETYQEVAKCLRQLGSPGQTVYCSYDAIVGRIGECVAAVWETLANMKGVAECERCPLLQLLTRLTKPEEDLRFVPGYREHFVHAFHVFSLGLAVLRTVVSKDMLSDEQRIVAYEDFVKGWFLSAIFHDIAYGVEKMEDLAACYYDRVLLGRPRQQGGIEPFHLNRAEFLRDHDLHNYLLRFDTWAGIEDRLAHSIARALVDKADHGILSSYVLYVTLAGIRTDRKQCKSNGGRCSAFWGGALTGVRGERLQVASCRAIAYHHAYEKHWRFDCGVNGGRSGFARPGAQNPVALKRQTRENTLLMLLVLCDAMAQAGRTFYEFDSEAGPRLEHNLRWASIDINQAMPEVSLVYSPVSGKISAEALQIYLLGPGRLRVENQNDYTDGKETPGGWYQKSQDMLRWFVDGNAAYGRHIGLNLLTSGHTDPEGRTDVKRLAKREEYKLPIPLDPNLILGVK